MHYKIEGLNEKRAQVDLAFKFINCSKLALLQASWYKHWFHVEFEGLKLQNTAAERWLYLQATVKPRLHERFFACDGDAIFLKIVASPARGENRMCSHPRTGNATDEKIAEKKSREIQ